jgi:NAD(P)-dependent dehydrogenase (short-subunit alcohol dehydrogenase family)
MLLAAGLVILAAVLDWRRAGFPGGRMNDAAVIITGVGGRGQLGYELAGQFARAGWQVLISGRSDAVTGFPADLAAAVPGARVAAVRADLLDEAQAAQVVAGALAQFGRVDALVNAAGGLSLVSRVEDTHLEELQHELDRNLATTLLMTRVALPALRAARGAIVNFASPAAFRAPASLAAYAAAKAGVVALTQALAAEEKATGVRVNAIAPGTMDTEQNIAESGADAAYVSRAAVSDVVLFLASPASRGISGETIRVLVTATDPA